MSMNRKKEVAKLKKADVYIYLLCYVKYNLHCNMQYYEFLEHCQGVFSEIKYGS